MSATTDPILARHLETRLDFIKARFPQINTDEYVGVVLQDRADRYAAHLATMTITPDLVQWALAMGRKYGPWVKVHHFIADWFTALLIVRYGEEPDAARSSDPTFAGWPTTFTDDDKARASELLDGIKWPAFLNFLPTES